ncbi:PAS domain protein [marine gamma proteobacterium HTCC2080]|nr:PAS domain protein [marine gamma proteobacterium HTCC2080]
MSSKENIDQNEALVAAIQLSQGVIEFNLDGTIISANQSFLDLMGYSFADIEGKHHKIFCSETYANSQEYAAFWERLNQGEFDTGEYVRFGKDGEAVYIRASYNPIIDENGQPYKVIKIASDVTTLKLENAEAQSKVAAIDLSQGTIEFAMDGTIITANESFLSTLGYSLDEIQGKHHSMFCDDAYAASEDYAKFWETLRSGTHHRGEFNRRGKNGRQLCIRATYNPIFNLKNEPVKVLKIADDISKQRRMEAERDKQQALIMEMSTPVMQLWDNILLLPVVGLVDSKRVQLIMETALQKILDYQAKLLILDIQGVPAVDSAVANHLIQITKATRLMGCTSIVTGISPEISQALVNLGIELGDIQTQATLKDGVSFSLANLGMKLQTINTN